MSTAGMVRLVLGFGVARNGSAGPGVPRQSGLVTAGSGLPRLGTAWHGRLGMAFQGWSRQISAGRATAVVFRQVWVWHAMARLGQAAVA